jgi:pyruvate dehydrogenase E1 component beta subunit
VKREGRDVTIIALSSMVQVALGAAKLLEEVGISAEVVDPRTTWPLDEKTMIDSVKKTSRCIVMDEGYARYGVAAELAAVVAQGAFYNLDAPVTRLCAMHVPISVLAGARGRHRTVGAAGGRPGDETVWASLKDLTM